MTTSDVMMSCDHMMNSLFKTHPPPFIYINSSRRQQLLTQDNPLAFVDAVACFNHRLFYDSVLNQLANWNVSWNSGCQNWSGRVLGQRWNDSFDSFVHGLQEFASTTSPSSNIIIAIDRAERLKVSLPDLIVPLSRLAELVRSLSFFLANPLNSPSPLLGTA